MKFCVNYIYNASFRLYDECSKRLAEWYFQKGKSCLSACCHLARNDIEVSAFANDTTKPTAAYFYIYKQFSFPL